MVKMNDFSKNSERQKGGAISQWLFNPFYYIAGGKALMIGSAAMLLTGLAANLGSSRFNGLLDFHLGLPIQPWWINISEILISWLIFCCLLLISGKIVSKSRIRPIDVFGTQALARLPYLFASLIAFIPAIPRFAQKLVSDPTALQHFSPDTILYILSIIFVLLMAAWMVALMYRAFSVSCNVVGKAAISVFIASLLVGEILSLTVLHYGSQSLHAQTLDTSTRGGELVTLLSKGEYAGVEKMFDEKMAAALPAEKLEEVWQSLITQVGPFRMQGTIRKAKIMGYDVVYVSCQFKRATLDCQVTFDGEGQVSGLYFIPASGN